jgi:hypothetical protein
MQMLSISERLVYSVWGGFVVFALSHRHLGII